MKILPCHVQKDAPVERCCRFLGALAAHLPAEDEACCIALEDLLEQLAGKLCALDKVVRFRAAQLLGNALQGLPASAQLSEGTLEELGEALTARLADKVTVVRAQAARALGRLCNADEVRPGSASGPLIQCTTCIESPLNTRVPISCSQGNNVLVIMQRCIHTTPHFGHCVAACAGGQLWV